MTTTLRFALAGMLVGACVDASPDAPDSTAIDYRRDVQPIWDRWCVGCHNFITPHLVVAESARDLQGASWFKCRQGTEHAAFVVPADPQASFLYYKLTAENPGQYWNGEACDRLMPADQEGMDVPLIRLDPDAVETVRRWIEEGAVFDSR